MSGATSWRTFRPSATTSGPIPSPGTTARRMGIDPRSAGGEVGGPGLAGTDPAGDVSQQLRRYGAVEGEGHEGLAALRRAAHLVAGDVDPRLPQCSAHGADHTRPVGVEEEEQVAREIEVHVEAEHLDQLGHLVLA